MDILRPVVHASVFSGIGGFDLAAMLVGWRNAFMVEKDVYCQEVLIKNFGALREGATNTGFPVIYGDIKEFDGSQWRGSVDVISGGFPCQPFSDAGRRAGESDDRFLWPEMCRVIGAVRPRVALLENVVGLLTMGGGSVLRRIYADLADAGYEVEPPVVLPASAVGAPHQRYRVFIIAYLKEVVADDYSWGCGQACANDNLFRGQSDFDHGYIGSFSDDNSEGLEEREGERKHSFEEQSPFIGDAWRLHWLEAVSRFCGVDDGLPGWVDGVGGVPSQSKKKAAGRRHRIAALGNAVVVPLVQEIFVNIDKVLRR